MVRGTPQNEHQHGTRYRKKSNQNGTEKTSKSGGTLQNEYQHGTRYRKKLN
jgi:hypothetical protein